LKSKQILAMAIQANLVSALNLVIVYIFLSILLGAEYATFDAPL